MKSRFGLTRGYELLTQHSVDEAREVVIIDTSEHTSDVTEILKTLLRAFWKNGQL